MAPAVGSVVWMLSWVMRGKLIGRVMQASLEGQLSKRP